MRSFKDIPCCATAALFLDKDQNTSCWNATFITAVRAIKSRWKHYLTCKNNRTCMGMLSHFQECCYTVINVLGNMKEFHAKVLKFHFVLCTLTLQEKVVKRKDFLRLTFPVHVKHFMGNHSVLSYTALKLCMYLFYSKEVNFFYLF